MSGAPCYHLARGERVELSERVGNVCSTDPQQQRILAHSLQRHDQEATEVQVTQLLVAVSSLRGPFSHHAQRNQYTAQEQASRFEQSSRRTRKNESNSLFSFMSRRRVSIALTWLLQYSLYMTKYLACRAVSR